MLPAEHAVDEVALRQRVIGPEQARQVAVAEPVLAGSAEDADRHQRLHQPPQMAVVRPGLPRDLGDGRGFVADRIGQPQPRRRPQGPRRPQPRCKLDEGEERIVGGWAAHDGCLARPLAEGYAG